MSLPTTFSEHFGLRILRHISTCTIAIASFVRGLRLLISPRPKTPLRVLCVMAFDAIHEIRYSTRMPVDTVKILVTFLDMAASANAFFDGKGFVRREYYDARRVLKAQGIHEVVQEYLSELRQLEKFRPSIGGECRHHRDVRIYRESVVRLSLQMITAIVFRAESTHQDFRRVRFDDDVKLLFSIVMQCQVIDDVLDYAKDVAAGLPSFQTVPASRCQATECTRNAATRYSNETTTGAILPLRAMLFSISHAALIVVAWVRWRFLAAAPKQPIMSEYAASVSGNTTKHGCENSRG